MSPMFKHLVKVEIEPLLGVLGEFWGAVGISSLILVRGWVFQGMKNVARWLGGFDGGGSIGR